MLLLAQKEFQTLLLFLGVAGLVLIFVIFGIFASYFRLWIQSFLTGAGIRIWDLLGMTFRKVSPKVIVHSKIMAVQAGLTDDPGITSKALEAHYLAGGNVPLVIRALIAAKKAKTIQLTFREATAIDLAGRNVLESVQTSVYPKVIDCPAKGSCQGIAGRRRQGRDSTESESSSDGTGQPAAVDRRSHRRDDHRPGWRRHRQRHRLGRNTRQGVWRTPT